MHQTRAPCSPPPTQRVQQLNCAARHRLKAPPSSLASRRPLRASPPAVASSRHAAPAVMPAAAAGAAGAPPAGPASEYAPFLEVALSAAKEAGAVIAAAWDQTKTIDTKSGGCGRSRVAAGAPVAPCCLPLAGRTGLLRPACPLPGLGSCLALVLASLPLHHLPAPLLIPITCPPVLQAMLIWSLRQTSGARSSSWAASGKPSPTTSSLGRRARQRRWVGPIMKRHQWGGRARQPRWAHSAPAASRHSCPHLPPIPSLCDSVAINPNVTLRVCLSVCLQGFTDELTDAPTWMVDPVDGEGVAGVHAVLGFAAARCLFLCVSLAAPCFLLTGCLPAQLPAHLSTSFPSPAGTTNFVHRFPFSCVSIGLTIGKQPVVGVVFNPILGELYEAVRGGGALLNGQPIRVSDTAQLSKAVVATELGTRRDECFMDACFHRIRTLGQQSRSLRCTGSCALNLCGVAMGRCGAGKGL